MSVRARWPVNPDERREALFLARCAKSFVEGRLDPSLHNRISFLLGLVNIPEDVIRSSDELELGNLLLKAEGVCRIISSNVRSRPWWKPDEGVVFVFVWLPLILIALFVSFWIIVSPYILFLWMHEIGWILCEFEEDVKPLGVIFAILFWFVVTFVLIFRKKIPVWIVSSVRCVRRAMSRFEEATRP